MIPSGFFSASLLFFSLSRDIRTVRSRFFCRLFARTRLLWLYFRPGEIDTPREQAQAKARLALYKVLSDLREGMWSFVQWGISTTQPQSFYTDYGHECLARFRHNLARPGHRAYLRGEHVQV